jgi:hypothetical protein
MVFCLFCISPPIVNTLLSHRLVAVSDAVLDVVSIDLCVLLQKGLWLHITFFFNAGFNAMVKCSGIECAQVKETLQALHATPMGTATLSELFKLLLYK